MIPHNADSDSRDKGFGRDADDSIRVLFANNYDMARARAGWRAGTYPAHHLYGTARLGNEFSIVDLPFSIVDRWARVTGLTHRRLGDVGQQVAATRWRRPRSVIYGAFAQDLAGLAILRATGLFATPVVGVFHSVPSGRTPYVASLRGFDRAIALSQYTRRGLVESGMRAERITVLGWGPDLDFAGFAPRVPADADAPVVATGKTGRDMQTLLQALRETGLPARIYGDRDELARVSPIPESVTIRPASSGDTSLSAPLTYDHTVADLRSAAVVAIPLLNPHPLYGLTEVIDALACGRPMILTRAPYFDFDIEQIGCGWWVKPGDADDWSEKLTVAMVDRDRLEQMGRAGRAWAEQHLNVNLFTEGLRGVLLDVAGPN